MDKRNLTCTITKAISFLEKIKYVKEYTILYMNIDKNEYNIHETVLWIHLLSLIKSSIHMVLLCIHTL